MMWRTHVLCGINTLWVLTIVPRDVLFYNFGVLAVCAALGALLPDLDASESKIKHLNIGGIKPLALPSIALHQAFGHRRLLHSLWGLVIAAVLAAPLIFYLDWTCWAALVLGYASHLCADACTKSGIPLLYPRLQRYNLLPQPYRFTTGSFAEETLQPLIAMAVMLLLLTHLGSIGA